MRNAQYHVYIVDAFNYVHDLIMFLERNSKNIYDRKLTFLKSLKHCHTNHNNIIINISLVLYCELEIMSLRNSHSHWMIKRTSLIIILNTIFILHAVLAIVYLINIILYLYFILNILNTHSYLIFIICIYFLIIYCSFYFFYIIHILYIYIQFLLSSLIFIYCIIYLYTHDTHCHYLQTL